MLIELIPKTPAGAAVVSEHGAIRRIVREVDRVEFSAREGPWLLVESSRDLRWIHASADTNFQTQPYGRDIPQDLLDQHEQRLRYQSFSEGDSRLRKSRVLGLVANGAQQLAGFSLIAATTLTSLAGIAAAVWLLVQGDWRIVLWGLGIAITGPYLLMIPMLLGVPIAALGARLAKSGNRALLLAVSILSQLFNSLIMALWFGAVLAVMIARAKSMSAIPTLMWCHCISVAPWSFLASKEPDNTYTHTTLLAYAIAIAVVLIRFALLGRVDAWSVGLYAVIMLGVGLAEALVALGIDRDKGAP